jgi:hemerythrin superfamily protein
MLQVLDEARDRLDGARGALKGLSREAAKRTGDGAQLLTAISRAAAKRADEGAHYALERARSDRVSWTMVAGALGVGFVTAFALLNSKKAANSAATAMTGDWYEGLSIDHARLEKLFRQIVDTTDAQAARRARLLESLNALLTRHALQKENVLYPALRATDQGASSMHLAAELFEIKTYLYELEGLPKDDPRWLRKAKALHKLVTEHIEAEEQVLPGFHERLSAAEAQRLTKAIHREALKLA